MQSCPQCEQTSESSANRLVRDSCGHQKCRICILADVEECKQCLENNTIQEKQIITNYNNHAPVITCNNSCKVKASRNDSTELEENANVKLNSDFETNGYDETKNLFDIHSSLKIKCKGSLPKRIYKSIVLPGHISVTQDPVIFKCNVCANTFRTKAHVKYHIYCDGTKKPYQCETCSREFVVRTHLDIHKLKHLESKPHICKICNKAFREAGKLKRHSFLHTKKRPHVCSVCGKSFSSKDTLKVHGLIHNKVKPYSCEMCSSQFSNSSNLKKHVLSHSDEKSHMCDQCGKRFKLKWALTVHRKSHSKIRSFHCKSCEKAFMNNKDLQRHELIHIDAKLFSCGLCNMGFKRKDNLKRHIRNAHPGENAEVIRNPMKLLSSTTSKVIEDNPNAINVITASPVTMKQQNEICNSKIEPRKNTVINGPLKLAFKTSAFKRSYNIRRNYDMDTASNCGPHNDLIASTNVCHKILSPHNPVIETGNNEVTSDSSRDLIPDKAEISVEDHIQKIASSSQVSQQNDTVTTPKIFRNKLPTYNKLSIDDIYERPHIVKNIKFKIPDNYSNNNNINHDILKNIIPLTPVSESSGINAADISDCTTYTNLKNVSTSVIVNTSNQPANMHWRRRMSQYNINDISQQLS